MELEKVIENLAVKADVSNLRRRSLVEKYASDQESYDKFLTVFSRIFAGRNIYPLIVGRKYRDIEAIISAGKEFSTPDNEAYEAMILREIYRNEHESDLDLQADDYGQALYLFYSSIGANKVKGDTTGFGYKMREMLECARILDTDGEISKDEFCEFLNSLHSSEELVENPDKINELIKQYCDEHPKMNLCYNIPYLYLANYIMVSHAPICTQNFLDFTKEVIDISTEVLDGEPQDFQRDNYARLAKYTLQNIGKLEDAKNKQEESKPKRKLKDFFKKSPN